MEKEEEEKDLYLLEICHEVITVDQGSSESHPYPVVGEKAQCNH
jgi:hypothetical protein